MNNHDDLDTFERFARRLATVEAEVQNPPPWRGESKVRPRTRFVGFEGGGRSLAVPGLLAVALLIAVIAGVPMLLGGATPSDVVVSPSASASPESGVVCDPATDDLVVRLDGVNALTTTTVRLGPLGAQPTASAPLEAIELVAGGTSEVTVTWVDPLARTRPPLDSFRALVRFPDGTIAPATPRIAGPGRVELTLPAGSGPARLEFEVGLSMTPCAPVGGGGALNVTFVPGPPAGALAVRSFPVWRDENGIPVGCDAIGVAYVTGTLRGNPGDPELVWLVASGARRLSIVWPEGFAVTFRPNAVLYNEAGRVVARDGETVELGEAPGASAAGTPADPYYASRILFDGCYPRRIATATPSVAPSPTAPAGAAACPTGETGFFALAPTLDRTIRLGDASVPFVTAGMGLRSGDYWADDVVPAWAGFDPRNPLTVQLRGETPIGETAVTGSLGMELTEGWLRFFPATDYNLAAGELPDLGSVAAMPLDARDGRLVWNVMRGRWLVALSVRWQTSCLAGDGTAYLLLDVGPAR